MVRDPFRDDAAPDLREVLDALDDPNSRKIMTSLDGPATAREIADTSDVPLSTIDRKLELPTDAFILAERTEIRPVTSARSAASVAVATDRRHRFRRSRLRYLRHRFRRPRPSSSR